MYLDFLGEGLFRELAEEFADLMYDRGLLSLRELEAGVRLEPGVAARHRDLGCRLVQDAKPALAREAFTKALEFDPGDLLSRLGLACALDAIGLTQTAMEHLQGCLDDRPEYCPAMVAMGYCLQKLGEPREAIRAYEQALRVNPGLRRTREKLSLLLESFENASGVESVREQLEGNTSNDSSETAEVAYSG